MKRDKNINAKLLEAIFKVIPEKELEESGDFWQGVTDGLQKKLAQLFEVKNRLDDLTEAGVIEKAAKLPKRGGTGRDKDKLVARTEEEQIILSQVKEAFTLTDYFNSEREKIIEVTELIKEFLIPLANIKNGLANMATGAAIKAFVDVIDAGQDGEQGIKEMPKRKGKISHTKYTVTQGDAFNDNEGKMIIRHELSKGRGYISLKISNSIANNELYGYSVATKKILTLILEKINEQAYSEGSLIRDYVTFSNDELIERGIYKTPQSALKGMKIALNVLTDMKIEGMLNFNKNKSLSLLPDSYQYGNIFRFGTYKKGQWGIYIEAKADWRFIFQAFSVLPDYYYSLPNRPSELLYLVFTTARQHTDDIKKRGYFCIGLRKIQEALHLPDENKTNHPQRDIKDVINDAIKEIDAAQIKKFGSEDLLFLSLEYDDSWNIRQFLDEGFLHVELSDFFAKPFIDIENDKIKNLKEAQRKKQRALKAKNDNEKSREQEVKHDKQ